MTQPQSNQVSLRRLGNAQTVGSRIQDKTDKMIRAFLTGDQALIPNLFDFTEEDPSLREELLHIYRSTLPQEGKGGPVPETIQILQGMALDGEFVGYNMVTGQASLYLADAARIKALTGTEFDVNKAYDKNIKGDLHAMRLDIDYSAGDKYTVKATRLTVNTAINEGNTIFVPFWVIQSIVRVLTALLSENAALGIVQSLQDDYKTRYISTKAKHIRKYSDSLLTTVPRPQAFPLQFFLYVPVLGAPSTTLGLTRIDILSLEKVTLIPESEVNNLPIAPLNPNPVASLVQDQVGAMFVSALFSEEHEKAREGVKKKFLAQLNSFGLGVSDSAGPSVLTKKMHELTAEQSMLVWKNTIPRALHEYLARASQTITRFELVETPISPTALSNLLNTHVVQILHLTKRGTYSRITATNNHALLAEMYGENYVANYESDNNRRRSALRFALQGLSLEEIETRTGVHLVVGPNGKDPVEDLAEEILGQSLANLGSEAVHQELERLAAQGNRRSGDGLVARALFEPAGSKFYYRTVPVERISRVAILSAPWKQ